MTEISIRGREFFLDGRPTYAGRVFEGHAVQGLLFNVRAVQVTFDDANPETRQYWAYPDTGEWDPERNVSEFCAALPSWREHGVLAFTINFQGGGALFAPAIYDHFDNNGFTSRGDVRPDYGERIARVLARADELGMAVIVGLFYCAHLRKLEDAKAIWRAGHEALSFLESTGRRNLLIEVANEADVCFRRSGYVFFRPDRVHEMIQTYRRAHPAFLYSCSLGGVNATTGAGIPPASLIESSDYVLLHGNGAREAELAAAIEAVQSHPAYRKCPKPLVVNEDSPGLPNLEVAWRRGVSWGYFDQGFGGAAAWAGDAYVDYRARPREKRYEELSGFQTPPVNWTINTDLKQAFFSRVAQITGAGPFVASS